MAAGDIVRWVASTAGPWSTGANWSTGSIPGDDEIALFDGSGQGDVDGGDVSSTFQLRTIIVQPEYTGNIGSSGNPLIHNIDTLGSNKEFLRIRGTGDFYFQNGGAGIGGDEDYSAFIDSPGTVSLDSDSNVDIVNVHVKRGNVIIAGALTGFLTLSDRRSKVTLNSHATSPSLVRIVAGTLTSNRTFDSASAIISVVGGKWIQTADVSASGIRVFVGVGGRWDYRPATEVAAGLTSLFLDGVLDLSNSKFLVAWNGYVVGPGGRVVGNAKQGGLTIPATGATQIDLRDEYPE